VVEVQREHATRVAANAARTARFLDENPLDLLMPAGHSLADAPLALPPGTRLAVPMEDH
jgi:hypothetical protein